MIKASIRRRYAEWRKRVGQSERLLMHLPTESVVKGEMMKKNPNEKKKKVKEKE